VGVRWDPTIDNGVVSDVVRGSISARLMREKPVVVAFLQYCLIRCNICLLGFEAFALPPLLKRALAIIENVHGANHSDVGTALDNLATLYDTEDRYSEAEPLLQRTLTIKRRRSDPTPGRWHQPR
jgi:hypothetical protein